ncbi:hypothetical protein JCM10213_008976 [Rhodosporidiobolus nylandii]
MAPQTLRFSVAYKDDRQNYRFKLDEPLPFSFLCQLITSRFDLPKSPALLGFQYEVLTNYTLPSSEEVLKQEDMANLEMFARQRSPTNPLVLTPLFLAKDITKPEDNELIVYPIPDTSASSSPPPLLASLNSSSAPTEGSVSRPDTGRLDEIVERIATLEEEHEALTENVRALRLDLDQPYDG